MANRLVSATSPYLLQHAHNPVDWYEWGPEALQRARDLNRPIFLSVGYAACHWCHVMAHESFEDPAIAEVINDHFVAIKVDREERPDIDAVYMQATQALTGQGGWPMSVFLTPEQQPFYAGTYFPPRPMSGMPSFRQVLEAVINAWEQRGAEVIDSARQITGSLAGLGPDGLAGELAAADLEEVLAAVQRDFDTVHGGFGRAPKFPPSMLLEALLRFGDQRGLSMAAQTLTAMARGGIYDQLGGGFARYSTDQAWVVPHFEKMLYDNALIVGSYTHWWRLSADPLAKRVVAETVQWLLEDLRTAEGAFASSLDADSADASGKMTEGAFYVWSRPELIAALGEEDGVWAAQTCQVTATGTFEDGRSTLQLLADPDLDRWARVREALRRARSERPRPARDDKVVTAWNALLIDSLAEAAMIFERPDWLTVALEAAELIWRAHWVDGVLRRASRDRRPGDALAILEDYATLASAYLRLCGATADPRWLDRARRLAEVILTQFDDGAGGFFDTATGAETLITRPRDVTDNATPSGLSSTVRALGALAEFTGEGRYAERAEQAISTHAELVRRAPRFAGWLLAEVVSRLASHPPVQIALVGQDDDQLHQLQTLAYRQAPAGSVIVAGSPEAPGIPLLQDRSMIEGRPTAYVCRGFVCRLPTTDPDQLAAQLAG